MQYTSVTSYQNKSSYYSDRLASDRRVALASCAKPNLGEHAGVGERQQQLFVTACPQLKAALTRLPAGGSSEQAHNILVLGPQGSGHSAFGRFAWSKAGGSNRPFVIANCRQIRGRRDVTRLFHKAHNGDLFLEDVDKLKPALVATFLELGAFDPQLRILGSVKTASEQEVELTRELQAMFPRIISIPPLHERRDDVPLIAMEALRAYPGMKISSAALVALRAYPWTREVPQLMHCIRQSVQVAQHHGASEISEELVGHCLDASERLYDYSHMLDALKMSDLLLVAKRWGVKETLRMIEGAVIASTLEETYGCSSHAASVLKVPINTLASRKKVLATHVRAFTQILESAESSETVYTP